MMQVSLKSTVQVLFFAKARELSGVSESKIQIASPVSVSDLLEILCRNYGLEAIKNSLILAVNEEYCHDSRAILQLRDGDEIAIIPPISGG